MADPLSTTLLIMKRAEELLDDIESGFRLMGMSPAVIGIMWTAIAHSASRRAEKK